MKSNKHEKGFSMHTIIRSFKRLPEAILKPALYFSAESGLWLDGLISTLLLFIVTWLQKLAWGNDLGSAALDSLLNSLMAWTGFFALYYLVMIIFKKKIHLPDLFGAAGVAGLPVTAATLISVLVWLVSSRFGAVPQPAWSTWVQTAVGLMGILLAWPGWMAWCIFKNQMKMTGAWPIILPVFFSSVLLVSWLVSIL
jgi:hypothetical protein